MPSVTIDLTEQEHDRLEAAAAREGRSVGEVIKDRALPDGGAHDADMNALGAFLARRVERLRREGGIAIPEGGLAKHIEARVARRDR